VGQRVGGGGGGFVEYVKRKKKEGGRVPSGVVDTSKRINRSFSKGNAGAWAKREIVEKRRKEEQIIGVITTGCGEGRYLRKKKETKEDAVKKQNLQGRGGTRAKAFKGV